MTKGKPKTRRSPVAASLSEGQYRHKVVRDKTKYRRKPKHRKEQI